MAINYGKLNAKLTPRGSLKATMGVSGPLNSDYEALINKPQINGNELIGNKTNADLGIPTALEDLTDDSTHRVVTDEQISAWDNKSDFSGSYNDLTDKPTIPDELADLTDDSTHRLVTDTEKTTWNAKSDFSGSYNDLTDVPANLVQDANYVHTDNNYDDTAKGKVNALGTASTKNVPVSGDASTSEVVLGNDTRLTDDRNAKDVYSWAKASTKPNYTATEVGAIASTLKGTANGVAELDANGKVPSAQLPSYVDDVLEYASTSAFPQTGESGKIYIALDTNKTYRWGGSAYVEISESLALGETDSTAYAGNKGKQNADNIATIQGLIPSSATTSNKLATANDIPDISGKADKSEMSVSTSDDLTTIQLKSGTSATVINAHQDISGKANKSEMSVSTSGDKTTIQLKSGTSAEVLNQHQDISGKVDKVEGKGLSTNDYDNTAKGIVDGVTSALADKVDKVNGKGLSTEDYTTAEKTKLGAISDEANKVTSSSTNGHINIDGVDTTVYDDTSVQSDIEDIQDELSTDSATVQGNPINFSTLTSQNAESTLIDLEPIQDLHGYSKPWVGGANVNKLPYPKTAQTKTDDGFTVTTDGNGGYTIIGSSVSGTGIDLIYFNLDDSYVAPDGSQYTIALQNSQAFNSIGLAFLYNGNLVAEVMLNATNRKVHYSSLSGVTYNQIGFRIDAAQNPSISTTLEVKPYIYYGNPSDNIPFSPYTNICPISGHDQIDILGCGKNLFDVNSGVSDNVSKAYIQDKKIYFANSNYSAVRYNLSVKKNVSYTISFSLDITTANGFVGATYTGTSILLFNRDYNTSGNYSLSFIATNSENISIAFSGTNANATGVFSNVQLEENDQATPYTPYTSSNSISEELQDTIYGGVLDLESGELVVDRDIYTLGNLTWTYDSTWKRFISQDLYALQYKDAARTQYLQSSDYEVLYHLEPISNEWNGKIYSGPSSNTGLMNLFVHDLRYTNTSDFLTAMGSSQVAYPLKDSYKTTINLTPHTINLLKGVNNISTDGDKITLTYRDGSVATLGDLTSAVDNLDSKIDESKILTDTVTGDKYILVVTNGVLSVEQVSN